MTKKFSWHWRVTSLVVVVLLVGLGWHWLNRSKISIIEHKADLIQFLQSYIRINTAHPAPDYQAVVELFKKHALADGLSFKQVSLPSGRCAMIIGYQGSDPTLPALALSSHMDVVAAASSELWSQPPFQANIINGVMISRGVQDCKGLGAVQYWVLKTLAQHRVSLRRSVYQLLTPDEEIGSDTGSGQLVNTPEFKALNIGFLIDEGTPSGEPGVITIKVSEKKQVWLIFNARGVQGHGSQMIADNAIEKLLQALLAIKNAISALQNKKIEPGLQLTANVTSFQAGDAAVINVIPSTASATLDMRVPPYMPVNHALTFLDRVLAKFPGVRYTPAINLVDYIASDVTTSLLYKVAQQAIKQQGFSAKILHESAASDSKYYLQHNITCIGLTPFFVKDEAHEVNESLPIQELEPAYAVLYGIVKDVCT